jgi:aspartate/glutamate racemase
MERKTQMSDAQRTVFIVHTSSVSVNDLSSLFSELDPSISVNNIVDDSLLPEVLANGGVTEGVKGRLTGYYEAAEAAGADLVFNQCSSVGDVADLGAGRVTVPLVRVDRPMAERACELGSRIGVVATLATTMAPTCRLIRAVAEEQGKEVEITEQLCEGAFDVLRSGDRERHNAMVIADIKALAGQVDVIVCAQGSMVALLDELSEGDVPVPVLTSPRSGVERAIETLRRLPDGTGI